MANRSSKERTGSLIPRTFRAGARPRQGCAACSLRALLSFSLAYSRRLSLASRAEADLQPSLCTPQGRVKWTRGPLRAPSLRDPGRAGLSPRWARAAARLGSPRGISVPAFRWPGAAISRVQGWGWPLLQYPCPRALPPSLFSPVAYLVIRALLDPQRAPFSPLAPSLS